MNKKLWITGMLVVLLAMSTACGNKPQAGPVDETQGSGTPINNESNGTDVPETTPIESEKDTEVNTDATSKTIDVYYTDNEWNELYRDQQEISYTTDLEKYKLTVEALQNSNNKEHVSLWNKVSFDEVTFADGTLVLDITLPDEARLGAGGEAFAIESLKNTMFQFAEVNEIELLVNGHQVESLMGHVTLDHPITRQ